MSRTAIARVAIALIDTAPIDTAPIDTAPAETASAEAAPAGKPTNYSSVEIAAERSPRISSSSAPKSIRT